MPEQWEIFEFYQKYTSQHLKSALLTNLPIHFLYLAFGEPIKRSRRRIRGSHCKSAFNISVMTHTKVAILDKLQHFQISRLSQNQVLEIILGELVQIDVA